jgi:hypothetical protein
MDNYESIKARAFEVRDMYLAGQIDYKEAKEMLKEYIELFNKKSEEIAARYNQRPKKLRVGDFLKNKYY